mmetsp:Transcript_70945/g.117887  ORF Transcript_70945/g.117887 Transcript_70945/m.117887 type:complete len:139 (+) Transcript_70945:56-472(+)|eukprot:CAMPEP_0119308696 /NCGR_PEP_ID=MMETSP1333-20130426/12172_1 /TAXON_ID=418940 /ORGANISM="Scyphosphaera apsteinii, Strain RCC1455" /LENGTH=138 /DNA_ID=CAMNT_0007312529 /DNA_START=46 /DNA_END=462 /DNA_ORIENTATION=+
MSDAAIARAESEAKTASSAAMHSAKLMQRYSQKALSSPARAIVNKATEPASGTGTFDMFKVTQALLGLGAKAVQQNAAPRLKAGVASAPGYVPEPEPAVKALTARVATLEEQTKMQDVTILKLMDRISELEKLLPPKV